MDEHARREPDAAMIRLADGDRSACSSVFRLLWPELDAAALAALRAGLAGLSASDRRVLDQAYLREREAPQPTAFRKRKERALGRLRAAWRKIHGD
jgi:hypothetical protein